MTTAGWQEGQDIRPPVFSNPRTGGGRGGQFDMTTFVNRVVDQFERETGTSVEPSARDALIQPALPYAEEVESGKLTIARLEAGLWQVLRGAKEMAGYRLVGGLNEVDMHESMRQYCPFVFWCF
jgi:hypothetical protein